MRIPRPEDVNRIVPAINDRRVARSTLRIPYPYSTQNALEFARRVPREFRSGRSLDLLIFDRNEATLIGGIGLAGFDWPNRKAELGYWISPAYWDQGYATEAVRKICQVGFRSLALHRIGALVFGFNSASARVLEKAGFVREGRCREAVRKGNRWVDDLVFGLLRAELRPTSRDE
jgi:RimJ/RimL family protein N-acetyltransferase